jgi:colanic acid/amylovoran biosynthesis protein
MNHIFVTGQCTLHWGRMEFGNIGNYYIMEPFFRELHRVFPGAEIRTTLQMSERFCREEGVTSVPMEVYYAWRDDELARAEHELQLSEEPQAGKLAGQTTPYIELVKWADLVVDFSGDIWGDNANFLGHDRFRVGLIKNRVAQNLGKPTVMLAGSPGPFSDPSTLMFAKQVYAGFDLVTNREPNSTRQLDKLGFDMSRTIDASCPAFMFTPAPPDSVKNLLGREELLPEQRVKPVVGFILCGWNFGQGPFDLWPREDAEYEVFAKNVLLITRSLGARVCLMSHSNGFDKPPAAFKAKHGRDYPVMKQLQRVLHDQGATDDVMCLDGVYDAWQTKAIIGSFDMLVSGRVHAAVAGLSQSVPTVIIDYGHPPKAHKLRGFATVAGVSEFVADPANGAELAETIERCWAQRKEIRESLDRRIPQVKDLSSQSFDYLSSMIE